MTTGDHQYDLIESARHACRAAADYRRLVVAKQDKVISDALKERLGEQRLNEIVDSFSRIYDDACDATATAAAHVRAVEKLLGIPEGFQLARPKRLGDGL